VRDAGEIERAVTDFASSGNRGLIVTASQLATIHRDAIVALAARRRLPAVYSDPYFVAAGGADFLLFSPLDWKPRPHPDDVAGVRGLGFAGAWVKHSPPKRLRNASAVAASGKQNRI
jgi:hypothetical protein